MEFRIQYMRLIISQFLSLDRVWEAYMCMCMPLCEYPPCITLALISQNSGLSPTHVPFSTYSDSDTHFRQPFYKHTPLTLLGLWYSVMGYPPMFRYSPCSTQPLTTHTGLPTSMHGCPPPLAWSLTLYTNLPPPCEFSHLWAYVFPLHAWPASYLISSGLN